MEALLSTKAGSVSGFELLFDTDNKVRLVIDESLLEDTYISGHPGISTSTIRLKKEDFLRYVETIGHAPTVVCLPDVRTTQE